MLRSLIPVAVVGSVFCAVASSGPVLGGGAGISNPTAAPTAANTPRRAKVKSSVGAKKQAKTATTAAKPSGTRKRDPRLSMAAKKLFGHERQAANMAPRAIGFYSKGCLSGGEMMPPVGPYWQAMRLSRNRNWAHPATIALLKKLAKGAHDHDGWRGLLVGDLTQPRGGPMLTGHSSHQVGLDADVWLREMPEDVMSRKKRDTYQPISMLKNSLSVDYKVFTDKIVALIRRAASYPEVARVGVNPAIKHALCKAAGGDTPWLRKIQGWGGHHYHMHIRLKCPAGSPGCRGQSAPRGTSCAASEKWYRNAKAWADLPAAEKKRRSAKANKNRKKRKPKPPITLSGLPDACRLVLDAQARGGVDIESIIVLPVQKPPPAPTLARGQ